MIEHPKNLHFELLNPYLSEKKRYFYINNLIFHDFWRTPIGGGRWGKPGGDPPWFDPTLQCGDCFDQTYDV